jgi:hypothetical protein
LKIIFTLLNGWDAEYAVWKCNTKAGSKRVAELELQFWVAVQTEMRGLVARSGEPDPTGLLGQLCEAQQRMEGAVLGKINAADQRRQAA